MSKTAKKLLGWKDLAMGAMIVTPGSAREYKTGDWRSQRPVYDAKACIHCMQCWVYCPDNAIMVKDGKVVGIDLEYCKGCGICARVCPSKPNKAIKMEIEKK